MAGFGAVHSVGHSLITYLSALYPQVPSATLPACNFQLVSSGQLTEFSPAGTVVTAYLFRIGLDPYLRNTGSVERPGDPATRPLALELHYLLTAWADNALAEQAVLSWVMLQLHQRPLLDRSILTAEGGWAVGDQIQIVPSELGHEDMMRIWDALDPAYRLSVAYVARVVRIDREAVPAGRPAVATRFDFDPVAAAGHA
jgi:Pvc16 N-terminal domain